MTSIPISGSSGGGGKGGGGKKNGGGHRRRRGSETDDEVSSDEEERGRHDEDEGGEGDSDEEFYDEEDEESYDDEDESSYESDEEDDGDEDYDRDDRHGRGGGGGGGRAVARMEEPSARARARSRSSSRSRSRSKGRGVRSARSVGVESAYAAQSVTSRASRTSSRRSQQQRSSRRFVVPKMSFMSRRSQYSESEYDRDEQESEYGLSTQYTDTSETTIFLLKRHVCQGLAVQTILVVGFVVILVTCLVVAVLISYGVFHVGGSGEMESGEATSSTGGGVEVPMPPQDLSILCSAGVVQLDEGRGRCEEACRAAACCFVTVEDDSDNDNDNSNEGVGNNDAHNATNSSCYDENRQVCDLYGSCAGVMEDGGGGTDDPPFKGGTVDRPGGADDLYREEAPPQPPQSSSPPARPDFDLNEGPEIVVPPEAEQGTDEEAVVGRPPPVRPGPPALASPANGQDEEVQLEMPTNGTNGTTSSQWPSGQPSAVPSSSTTPSPTSTFAPTVNETLHEEDDSVGEEDGDGGDDEDYNAIKVRMRYIGLGWVGFAVSPPNNDPTKPSMVGGQAVIGLPASDPGRLRGGGVPRAGFGGGEGEDVHNVFKYDLTGKSVEGVVMMDMSRQRSLVNATVTQDEIMGETVLEFVRLLNETSDGEIDIDPRVDGTFLWAVGSDNSLGYHAERGHFVLNPSGCRQQSCYSTDPEYDEEIELSPERLTLQYKLIAI